MNTATTGLLLVDLQEDYLGRPGLAPERKVLVANAARLLGAFRRCRLPVFHAVTRIGADGSGRMPHWQRADRWQCVAGTPGALPPPELAPADDEVVFVKPFFSAFGNPDLLPALRAANVDRLVIAGLYTHACVRATALDAYQAGLTVDLAEDAVAACEVEHARISLDYLAQRAVHRTNVAGLIEALAASAAAPAIARDLPCWQQRNPADWQDVLGEVPIEGPGEIMAAIQQAQRWQKHWAGTPPAERLSLLRRWVEGLAARREAFIALMIREIGKPRCDAEGEWTYALSLLRQAITEFGQDEALPGGAVRYRPRGIVGVITPWNNPLAIPLGKLAPALAYSNGVVWKPAPQATAVSALIHESLADAGLGDGVRLVHGDGTTGQWLAQLSNIAALSFTGSIPAGRQLARLCAATYRPFQAELGGNNAVLVMGDVNLEQAALDIAEASFSFSGQRCTAPRRIIVDERVKFRFETALTAAVEALAIGRPEDPATRIGPVISRQKQQALLALVAASRAAGGRLLCGGNIPEEFARGCWLTPTLVADPAIDAPIVREESFGPLAVVLGARDIGHALFLCNHVEQGLAASLFSDDPRIQQRFLAEAEAGILSLNQARPLFAAAAPFGGWKASGMGIPEHGRWDRDFYSRAQAVYGSSGDD